jgi:bifunctional non-homologous end joining protein LigD
MRNGYAQTTVAPYAVRARPQAPVATPLHLEELADERTRSDRWTLRTVPARLQRDGDPWKHIGTGRQTLASARRLLDEAILSA